jgi:tyrosine-protein kinase Etk/Wzc
MNPLNANMAVESETDRVRADGMQSSVGAVVLDPAALDSRSPGSRSSDSSSPDSQLPDSQPLGERSLRSLEDRPWRTEIDLLDFMILLARNLKLIAGATAGVMLLAGGVVLLLPATYTATATLLPPQRSQSLAASIVGQMGALAGLAGKDLSLKNPADLYVAILKSRTVADALIRQFDLLRVYRVRRFEDARKKLLRRSTIEAAEKTGLISVSVEDRDPRRSAALANAYLDGLHALNQTLAISEAAERRLFFQQQIEAEREELARAELDLQQTQEQTGMIQLDAQGKAIIEAVARTRAEIAVGEVQLETRRSFSTDQNPDVVRSERGLAALHAQLATLERDSKPGNGNIQVPTGKVPAAALEYLRRVRDVKYHETLYEFLAKQLEAAKIDEANDSGILQVVDRAVEPEKRSGPPRMLIIALATFLGFLGSAFYVLLSEALHRLRLLPDVEPRWRLLKASVSRFVAKPEPERSSALRASE